MRVLVAASLVLLSGFVTFIALSDTGASTASTS